MDPDWPASSAALPHLRPHLGSARLRANWPGSGLVRALGLREPMPQGLVRRGGGTGDLFLALFHQPVTVRLPAGRGEVPANSLVAWLPGMAHEYGRSDAAWLHSWLHLRGSLALALAEGAGLPAGVAIALPDPALLEAPLLELHGELARAQPDRAVIEALALVLLRRLARLAPAAGDGLAEVRRLIAASPEARHRLVDLAAVAGCSPQHLCGAFRRRFGTTPVAFASGLRLERAARLLRGGLPAGAVAAQCGWADARQFARVFAARFGATPAAWRDGGTEPPRAGGLSGRREQPPG
jgi:AraC-like DNA-binding protein